MIDVVVPSSLLPVVFKWHVFLIFVLQDLGIRIPRPLGNGPSRFIPEKEVRSCLH